MKTRIRISRGILGLAIGFALALPSCQPMDDVLGQIANDSDAIPSTDWTDIVDRCRGECACEAPGCSMLCDYQITLERPCQFRCLEGASCRFGCQQGWCSNECQSGSTCRLACWGGSCQTDCQGSEVCGVECSAGNCNTICRDTAECVMGCPGGGCTLECEGSQSCRIDRCVQGCKLECGGAETCELSCGAENNCELIP